MGAPMLAALRAGGFDARGFDVRPPSEFGDLTPFMSDDPVAFGHDLETLITVVRDMPQTEDVLFGAQSFTALPGLKTVVISSTLSPRYVRGLRARVPARIALVDAPMSGARIAAQQARLSFMLGGDTGDLDALQPLFAAMGAHFHRMGAFGAGMQAKVLNNLLAASHVVMTRAVLDWADAAGLDQQALLALIDTSSGQNWFASHFDEIEFSRDGHAPENTLGIIVKDVQSALDAAPAGADTRLPALLTELLAGLPPRA